MKQLLYIVNNETRLALTLLNNALKITVTNVDCLSEREIDIMQSIAILYAEIKEYEKSINILKMFKNFDNLIS